MEGYKYLVYHLESGLVIEIRETEPVHQTGYSYALSDQHKPGDEFEFSIWVIRVNHNKILVSHTSIRNNPQAERLLRESVEIKNDMNEAILELTMLLAMQSAPQTEDD
ncbi:hypothetical protein [Geomicrobium sediminis]|uniref:Uncharacterized protein n=1 Tax=Geomicrobium sediminis TaxID=1347788 RepID=A0ABS2P6S0_9BACL|nr:hypothetical protein [Geomicrobium sediminis]MBM7631088.1 hypothetical protein [Geomicrobium sediminis]